ncbi:MAG TPA: histidine kinase [Methyloceanibacter sp.]|nr:histidine kinase [Methyloceanibacter sp.]
MRILLMQDGTLAMQAPHTSGGRQEHSRAPKWFASLVSPTLTGRSIKVVSTSHADPVILIAEPADEIAEAWHDFSSLAIVWVALNGLVIGILYWVLGRVLAPLASLAGGMKSLRGGKYAVRIKPPRARELALITDHFNRLAGGLDSAREENSRLYRRLIAAQEQVRREIANDLHDEAGACLFGIAANASSIRVCVNDQQGRPAALLREHAAKILDGADQLKAMNRRILKQLRPGPLGQIKLALIVEELVNDLQRSNKGIRFAMRFGSLARSYDESVDLAIYRSIQEGVTAAVRSGKSKNISIDLGEHGSSAQSGRRGKQPTLRLVLWFDRAIFVRSKPKDLAIATMEERAKSLGGTCAIRLASLKETTIRIEIPIKRSAGECGLGP